MLTLWSNEQRVTRSELADTLQPADWTPVLDAAGLSVDGGHQLMARMVDSEAMIVAIDRVFLFTSFATLVSALLAWAVPRQAADGIR